MVVGALKVILQSSSAVDEEVGARNVPGWTIIIVNAKLKMKERNEKRNVRNVHIAVKMQYIKSVKNVPSKRVVVCNDKVLLQDIIRLGCCDLSSNWVSNETRERGDYWKGKVRLILKNSQNSHNRVDILTMGLCPNCWKDHGRLFSGKKREEEKHKRCE